MTAEQYRELDAAVEIALGWHLASPGKETDEHSIAPLWRHQDGRERVGGPRRYSTDPVATAEVKRWIVEQGWNYGSGVEDMDGNTAFGSVWTGKRGSGCALFTKTEDPADHDHDPVKAEAVALCRAVLAAVEATGAGKEEPNG